MNAVDLILCRIEQVAIMVSSIAMFVIMVMIFLDAMMRYLFNSPLTFTFDMITMYLLSAAVVLALSYTLRQGGHVSVELFAEMIPPRVYHVLVGLGLLATAVVLAIMAQRTTGLSIESWQRAETTVGLHAMPVWPSKAIVAVSLIVLTLRTIHVGLSNLLAGITGDLTVALRISHLAENPQEEAV